uniref:CBM20 domain-containing protein n=1 Tax=Chromera velia CCMP2878 TaxID=1169474 RepID=A0A0G4FNP9_9ALVE|eukprot:Cvel_3523.t1-p1 / transcript=Cvel_3523.t1 / gene=Cvel_3523 / organism=Chromera_velia_CCMP2878 / gene_product=hypothetical protein / transcript_product=hypothetical protein / location=Cvel_scaffold143:72771-74338(+) / protein_length=462 / sequence_SO=supercontig / SO=protein_coding / is_pseudo=false
MMEAETGGVVFACAGVEPREGQTLVVVGSSSALGGWDASRGVTLHRVKASGFPSGVWMSFPMWHKACSELQFQFALVGPCADSVLSGSLRCDYAMTFCNSQSQVDGGQRSSEATLTSLTACPSAAASTDGRSEDCCGCVWEPLRGEARQVEVVDGGLALFGGRWGDVETQVTPLTWDDIVLAQQQLEQDTLPSVSSEFETERERRGEIGASSEDEVIVSDGYVTAEAHCASFGASTTVLSSSPRIRDTSQREGGKGTEGGEGILVPENEADFLNHRSMTAESGEKGGESDGGGVPSPSDNGDILMPSAASSERHGLSVSDCDSGTSVSVFVERGRDEELRMRRGRGRGHDDSDEPSRSSLKRRCEEGGEGLLGGKNEASVECLGGGHLSVSGPFLLVVESGCLSVSREEQVEGQSQLVSAVCEGPKRRRLSSPSAAVSESHNGQIDRRGGKGKETDRKGDGV